MNKLVECVPNFSEGRRLDVVAQIVAAIQGVPGIRLLDVSSDPDHNRSVVTFLGEADPVRQAAFLGAAKAADLIDMEEHRGGHPRIGATDVIPFVPIGATTLAECVVLAQEVGRDIGEKLGIPVYLYEAAATCPERRNLPQVRQGQYEGLKEAISSPGRQPDFGPARLHPTAGATAVGARLPLLAYNINLGTADLAVARAIAGVIRERDGGYPGIKAMGVMLEDRGVAQVSINVCNYREVSLWRVMEAVQKEAAGYGVKVTGSEIVGLVPMEALLDTATFYLKLEGFHPEQVLEQRLLEED